VDLPWEQRPLAVEWRSELKRPKMKRPVGNRPGERREADRPVGSGERQEADRPVVERQEGRSSIRTVIRTVKGRHCKHVLSAAAGASFAEGRQS